MKPRFVLMLLCASRGNALNIKQEKLLIDSQGDKQQVGIFTRRSVAPSDIKGSDILALFINLPDRPARRELMEKQFQAMNIPAIRLEGTPDGSGVQEVLLFLEAAKRCAEETSAKYCLITEDDAVFNPQKALTANAPWFFSELQKTMEELPGGIQGPWVGLHLCGTEFPISPSRRGHQRLQGVPWPTTGRGKAADYYGPKRLMMSGGPATLLLKQSEADRYATAVEEFMASAGNHQVPIDVLQPLLYGRHTYINREKGYPISADLSQESEARAREHSTMTTPTSKLTDKVFFAQDPALCQHLTALTFDPKYASSNE